MSGDRLGVRVENGTPSNRGRYPSQYARGFDPLRQQAAKGTYGAKAHIVATFMA